MKTNVCPLQTARRPADECSPAFTLLELLAVIVVLAILAAMLLPALARTRSSSQGQACLDNRAQLVRALLLYAADHTDYLPPNPDDGNTVAYHAWVGGSAGQGGAQEFNPDILGDPSRSLLYPYLNADTAVFRCPDDLRTGRYQGTNAALRGQIVPAARSYAMNVAVGTNPYRPGGKQPTDAPWLDGQHGHTANETWFTFARTTDLRNPGPAKTFVFLDEDYRSINDGVFAVVGPYPGQQKYSMIDWPATYHDYGASFAFADGHAELHAWQDPRTGVKGFPSVETQPGSVDLLWMSEHATALVRQPQHAVGGNPAASTFNIALPALKGANYVLEYKDSLAATNWTPLPAVSATNSGTLQLVDPAATVPQRFYRAWTP